MRKKDQYPELHIKKVVVKAAGGADIDDCLSQSIILALKEKRTVEAIHNDKMFRIVPSDLIAHLYEDHVKVSEDLV